VLFAYDLRQNPVRRPAIRILAGDGIGSLLRQQVWRAGGSKKGRENEVSHRLPRSCSMPWTISPKARKLLPADWVEQKPDHEIDD
jgi:hypothetical protein